MPVALKVAAAIWGINHAFEKFLVFAEELKKNYDRFISLLKSIRRSGSSRERGNINDGDTPSGHPKGNNVTTSGSEREPTT
jgi:hypothetical protein